MKSFLTYLVMVLDEFIGGRTKGSIDESVNAKRALLSWGILAVLFGGIGLIRDKTFDDFITVVVVTVALEVIFLPRYFIRKKGGYDLPREGIEANPKYVRMEQTYMKIVGRIAIALLIMILIVVVVLLFNYKLHFWW